MTGPGNVDANRRRMERVAESYEECQISPSCQFEKELDKRTKHVYGCYRSYEGRLIYESRRLDMKEDDKPKGSVSLINLIYVPPQFRQRSIAVDFIRDVTSCADKTECLITAVCRPFEYRYRDDLAGMSPDDQMKKIARDFSDWELSLEYLDLGKRSNKLKQKRMKNRFKDWGFERINIREGMEYKDKFGPWALAYVPSSIDPYFLRDIKWRLPERKRKSF
tara:strand:+ start:344 stop:1006 length:663 start_codon:yes stop_codon:yes gene_type:complete